jgi:peptidoglycan/xylan/chitin deacetylase (PgdA/CDA1 family)
MTVAARERSAVTRQAALFMQRFKRGEFGAQWEELAPTARGMWPSRSARAGMLGHKFGSAGVDSVRIGVPAPGAVWTSQENPRVSMAGTWRVPVTVGFRDASRLRPSGVASAYTGLDLYLSVSPSHRRALVVGEGPASIDAPVLVPARLPTSSTRVPILMYHLVGPYPQRRQWTDDYGYTIEYGLTVPPAQFAGEMTYLHDHGYHAVSLTRLADSLLYGLRLPSHPVALTFDDGRESPWTYAVPLLRRYGFTATFFVCSGFVGQTNETTQHLNVQHYLSWTQVSDLARGGFWLEDHGQKDLNVLWGSSARQLRTEVQQSAQLLIAHTHQPIQFIAYTGALWPFAVAAQSGPEQEALFSRLAGFGYVGGVVDAHVPSVYEMSTQLWQLPRVRVMPGESMGEFVASLR